MQPLLVKAIRITILNSFEHDYRENRQWYLAHSNVFQTSATPSLNANAVMLCFRSCDEGKLRADVWFGDANQGMIC